VPKGKQRKGKEWEQGKKEIQTWLISGFKEGLEKNKGKLKVCPLRQEKTFLPLV
jgi:hypothetical protein